MVSIIKNQILKHLSRFTKNLSADKINLSTFKGEGELTHLELDEIVLTDLLELPSWLRLKSAWCNRVGFRIQWTKLKTVPIQLSLDSVLVEVETCDELRSTSCQQGLSSYAGAAKYSFIHKVIDGMTITVNTVQITFKSPAFVASVELTRILVESKSPYWSRCDLRMTRLKDNERGQVLLFKELEWQNVRIEARSTQDASLTPLRLLTNQARCRITLKKRMSDSFILGSRLCVILDDLLWVLTDFQLKAALHFIDSLAGLIQKANEFTRKKKAARKLEVLPEYQAQQSQAARNKGSVPGTKIFDKHDVIETCYHFLAQKIDLHFCDDPGAGRSCHPELKNGGALQLSLSNFQVDYYPYHLAAGDRKHWARYKEERSPHSKWLKQSLNSFKNVLFDLVDGGTGGSGARLSNMHLYRSQDEQMSSPQETKSQVCSDPVSQHVLTQISKLMTICVVLKMEDFTLYQVTTSGAKKHVPKEFISGDRDKYSYQVDPIIHAEFTYFYFPGDDPFPLPTPKFYVYLNPVKIYFDVITCLWANSFAVNLHRSLMEAANQDTAAGLMYFDVKIEAILPRVILESAIDHPGQKDRPKSLHIFVSRATITNVRGVEHCRADLEKCIDTFQMGSLFYNGDFPSIPGDYTLVSEKFMAHAKGSDNVRPTPLPIIANSVEELTSQFSRDLLWTEAKDIWCLNFDPVWLDFYGTRAIGKEKPVPFLDVFPLTLWVYVKLPTETEQTAACVADDGTADIHVLAHIPTLLSLQLNHYQLLFLLRLSEEAQELATYLTVDTNRILKKKKGGSLVAGAVIPQVEVTLVMPSQQPGKESSGGDVESVYPDSSSMQDEVIGSTGHWHSSNSAVNIMEKNRSLVNDFSLEIQRDCTNENLSEAPIPIQQQQQTNSIKTVNGNAAKISQESPHAPRPTRQDSQTFPSLNLSSNINVGFNSIKKGFTNFKTSLDSALKNSPDDISDTVSEKSNASSDNEMFVMVMGGDCTGGAVDRFTDAVEAMFRVSSNNEPPKQPTAAPVELASEVLEEDNTITSPSERDSLTSYCRRRDLVSLSTFKLAKVEFLQQSSGLSTAIKLQVSSVCSDDCSSIPWDEFQNKFSARTRGWSEVPPDAGVQPRIQLRLNHIVKPNCSVVNDLQVLDRSSVVKWFEDDVKIKVKNISLELNASTVVGLIDLVEDEVIGTVLPAEIQIDNVNLHLVEDRPPCNITSPGPIPIDVKLTKMVVNRSSTNVVTIECPTVNMDNSHGYGLSKCDKSLIHQLKYENEELRRRLIVSDRITEENYRLRKSLEEMEVLRSCLTEAQTTIASLLQEKELLLEKFRNQSSERNFQR